MLLQTWSSPDRTGKRLREQEAKWLFWFMGCGPEKQIALAQKITAQTLEHSLGTEWEKVCYLYSQQDAAFLRLTANYKKELCPSHLEGWLQGIKYPEVFFRIPLFHPTTFKAMFSMHASDFSSICSKQVLFRQGLWAHYC